MKKIIFTKMGFREQSFGTHEFLKRFSLILNCEEILFESGLRSC